MTRRFARFHLRAVHFSAFVVLLAFGCGQAPSTRDGGCRSGTCQDGGGVDAGPAQDAGASLDAGLSPDAGPVDAGEGADAGMPEDAGADGGPSGDAGSPADAGPDGGPVDAGALDAGQTDAGSDAGQWLLQVATSGTGMVSSDVLGISCSSTASVQSGVCSVSAPNGTVITLTASEPDGTSTFGSFDGGGCSASPCTVTLSAPTLVTASFESALAFDGMASSDVTVSPNSPFNTGSVTVETSLAVSGTSAPAPNVVLVANGDPYAASPSGYALALFWDGTQFHPEFAVSVAGSLNSCSGVGSVSAGSHQLAGEYDSTTGILSAYLDGSLVCSATASPAGTMDAASGALVFGALSTPDSQVAPFTGTLDDVRLSDIARYVGAIINPPRHPQTDAHTVGLWPMDEGAGLTVNDLSGNSGRNGTLASGSHVTWVPEP